jgi:type IV pilus assembly protein PilB
MTLEVTTAIKNGTLEQSNFIDHQKLSDKALDLFIKGLTSIDEIYSILIN